MSEEQKPKAGEWWVANDGTKIGYVCGFDSEGDPVVEYSGHDDYEMATFLTHWHHEPRCTGFDWVEPPAEVWPKWYILDETKGKSAVGPWAIERYTEHESIRHGFDEDGNSTIEKGTFPMSKPVSWKEVTEAEVMARLKPETVPKTPTRNDKPEDGWRWLDKDEHVLDGDEFYLGSKGWVKSFNHLDPKPRQSDTLYRRRIVVESKDDWIESTDTSHVLRRDVDEYRQSLAGGGVWTLVHNWNGLTCKQVGITKWRCRRKDLPKPAKPRSKIRLFWHDGGNVIARYDVNWFPSDMLEIHSDGNGGWYVEE